MRLTKLAAILLAVTTCVICYTPVLATDAQRSEVKTIKAGLLSSTTHDGDSIPPTLISVNTTQASKKKQTLVLPAEMEAKFPDSDGEVVYKILSARLEPLNTKSRALKFKVRCTSNTRIGGTNFWSQSFRLLIDGVPQSPSNNLNEFVAPHSAKEGEVVFTVPISTLTAILKIGDKETSDIPWDFSAAKPLPEGKSDPFAYASIPSSMPQTLVLPDGMESKFPENQVVYKILSARLEPLNTKSRALKFKVRCTSNDKYGFNFWSRSFRLLIDGVPQAPSNDLNELVEPSSAKEGEVVFTVPVSTRTAILRIQDNETTDIPWDFTARKQ